MSPASSPARDRRIGAPLPARLRVPRPMKLKRNAQATHSVAKSSATARSWSRRRLGEFLPGAQSLALQHSPEHSDFIRDMFFKVRGDMLQE